MEHIQFLRAQVSAYYSLGEEFTLDTPTVRNAILTLKEQGVSLPEDLADELNHII